MLIGSGRAEMFFHGAELSKLDDAGRLVIPSPFRKKFETFGNQVFVTRSFDQEHPRLVIYPMPVWKDIESALFRSDEYSEIEKMRFIHFINEECIETVLDDKGRVHLKKEMKKYARIRKHIKIIGFFNVVQLWAPDVYEQFKSSHHITKGLLKAVPY